MGLTLFDPNIANYEAHKIVDPDFQFKLREVRREYVEAVDYLLKKIGERDSIRTESDWEALKFVISFYSARWPDDFKNFKETIPQIRDTRNRGGYSQSGEIRYVGALPPALERLIKICFPFQQFDKQFVQELVNKIRLFKVGGEGN